MQASVRILWVAAVGVALALMLVAGTPAALAYDGPTTGLAKAFHPLYNFSSGHASYEDGPVELPHPVDPAPGSFSATSSMTPSAPTSGKGGVPALTGAMPGGRSSGPILDGATRAERSIQQVIRKLG